MSEGLVVTGLKKQYGNGVQALAGVDLQVKPSLYGLLGSNGGRGVKTSGQVMKKHPMTIK